MRARDNHPIIDSSESPTRDFFFVIYTALAIIIIGILFCFMISGCIIGNDNLDDTFRQPVIDLTIYNNLGINTEHISINLLEVKDNEDDYIAESPVLSLELYELMMIVMSIQKRSETVRAI